MVTNYGVQTSLNLIVPILSTLRPCTNDTQVSIGTRDLFERNDGRWITEYFFPGHLGKKSLTGPVWVWRVFPNKEEVHHKPCFLFLVYKTRLLDMIPWWRHTYVRDTLVFDTSVYSSGTRTGSRVKQELKRTLVTNTRGVEESLRSQSSMTWEKRTLISYRFGVWIRWKVEESYGKETVDLEIMVTLIYD